MCNPIRAGALSLILAALTVLGGCAGLGVGRDDPSVTVKSFRAVPGNGLPGFEIVLVVLNPNPEPLGLEGVAYSIDLNGQRLLQGVSNRMPRIDGYGQAEVTLNATINVLGGVRLLNRLLNKRDTGLEYEFTARLDPEGRGRDIRVSESGRLDASSLRR